MFLSCIIFWQLWWIFSVLLSKQHNPSSLHGLSVKKKKHTKAWLRILCPSCFPADLYYGGEAFSVEQPQAFTCPYCGRMGYTEISLQEHVAAEHTETSVEVVSWCWSFTLSCLLDPDKMFARISTPGKIYVCVDFSSHASEFISQRGELSQCPKKSLIWEDSVGFIQTIMFKSVNLPHFKMSQACSAVSLSAHNVRQKKYTWWHFL